MSRVVRLADYRLRPRRIFFSRIELNQLLSVYSRQVMRGEWRDYAIDQQEAAALFSVFRHTHESPLYTIVKTAPEARAGEYALLQGRRRLASGGSLGDVLPSLLRALGPMPVPLDGEGCR
jgi:hypothetical protein